MRPISLRTGIVGLADVQIALEARELGVEDKVDNARDCVRAMSWRIGAETCGTLLSAWAKLSSRTNTAKMIFQMKSMRPSKKGDTEIRGFQAKTAR